MLQIYTVPVTPFAQNARIIYEPESSSALVVDPGGEIDLLLSVVREMQPKELRCLLTHAHIDHAGGASEFLRLAREEFYQSVPLIAHQDPILRKSIQQQARLFGLPTYEYQNAPDPDIVLAEGDAFAIGNNQAKVMWVPGHAPDHLTLFFDVPEFTLHEAGSTEQISAPVLLAGDTLFAGSIGRTDLPGGSLPLLLRMITEKLLVLPDNTVVLCGHGPSTTIGEERKYNPFLQE